MSTAIETRPSDEDTLRVRRPVRLAAMDLDPPAQPVPPEVIAYFEGALAREAARRARSARRQG